MGQPRENVYTCEKCGGYTVTVDVAEGVTPFMLRCRATGEVGKCDGWAYSAMYPTGPRPKRIPAPAWEWYRPDRSEYVGSSEQMREHFDKGGLALRPRTNAVPVEHAERVGSS